MQKINIFRAVAKPELLFSLPLMHLFWNSSFSPSYLWNLITCGWPDTVSPSNNCFWKLYLTTAFTSPPIILVFRKARQGGLGFVFSFLSGALLIGWVGSWLFEVLLATGVFHDTKGSKLLFHCRLHRLYGLLFFLGFITVWIYLLSLPVWFFIVFLSLHENVSFLRAGSWPVLFLTALWVFSIWQAFK